MITQPTPNGERYGTEHCANDRLPAEKLEQAVTQRLWQVLDDHDLTSRAIDEAYQRLTQRDSEHDDELAAIKQKLAETRSAMGRYFRAFEAGTMPEDTCAPRIATLNEQAKALEARTGELAALDDAEQPERTTDADLRALRNALRVALDAGTPQRIKTILQDLTEEIRVDARDAIEPTFVLPAVRPPSGSMEPTRLNANRFASLAGGRMSLDEAD